jgi:hypothetical protein
MFGRIGFWIEWYQLDGLDTNQSRDIRVYNSGEKPKEKLLSSSETPKSSFIF